MIAVEPLAIVNRDHFLQISQKANGYSQKLERFISYADHPVLSVPAGAA